LSVVRRAAILHGVSFSVREGEVVCLLGPNGASKTTTILTITDTWSRAPAASASRGGGPPSRHEQGRDMLHRQSAEPEGNEFVLRNYLSV
jgi:ABC-type Mn2+/Zn2+ transport system ATPase subunit